MKKIIIIISIIFINLINVYSQMDTIRIHTSAQCETCKKIIEEYMSFEKGIKKSELDLETNILTVIYNADKTNAEKIKKAVTKSGYDADSIPADPKAYRRLPDCCKKPEEGKPVKH